MVREKRPPTYLISPVRFSRWIASNEQKATAGCLAQAIPWMGRWTGLWVGKWELDRWRNQRNDAVFWSFHILKILKLKQRIEQDRSSWIVMWNDLPLTGLNASWHVLQKDCSIFDEELVQSWKDSGTETEYQPRRELEFQQQYYQLSKIIELLFFESSLFINKNSKKKCLKTQNSNSQISSDQLRARHLLL